MKRILILIIFCLFILTLYSFPAQAVNQSRLTEFVTLKTMTKTASDYRTAITNSKPTLIEFYADWCSSCQHFAPILNQIHQTYSNDLNLVMINIDDVSETAKIEQYHVTGIPHLVLLNQNQQIIQSWVGIVPKTILENAIYQVF